MTMTKIDIVESIYEKLSMPKKDCSRIIESVFDIIKSEFEKGSQVNISGFGKWSVKAKKKRKGRNPQTGESLTIDARKVVTFKPSAVLRAKVNG
jgi:integration host factor subunit alpha